MDALFGRPVRRDVLREELVRMVVLAFAQGVPRRLSSYKSEARKARLGSERRTKQAFDELVAMGAVLFQPDPTDRRARIVVPTAKLINFYNNYMPILLTQAASLANTPSSTS